MGAEEPSAGSGAYRLRRATASDAAAVVDLWTEAYVTLGVGGRHDPYEASDFEASSAGAEVTVAEAADRVVGVVALSPPGAPGGEVARPGEAELSRLAVAASARGRGIGRALAERCGERARAAGWPAIALWSRRAQVEAHRLYESLGYRRVPERDGVDATGLERLVFLLATEWPRSARFRIPQGA